MKQFKVPASLFDTIVGLNIQLNRNMKQTIDTYTLTIDGDFGSYQIVSVPDANFTKEETKTVRFYEFKE